MVMPSFACRRRSSRMVSIITPRRELSVPHETLTAPREKMIVPREALIRLLVEATVLLPKRNSTKVGCNPTARWCECHRVVDHRHRAVDTRPITHPHVHGATCHPVLLNAPAPAIPARPNVLRPCVRPTLFRSWHDPILPSVHASQSSRRGPLDQHTPKRCNAWSSTLSWSTTATARASVRDNDRDARRSSAGRRTELARGDR